MFLQDLKIIFQNVTKYSNTATRLACYDNVVKKMVQQLKREIVQNKSSRNQWEVSVEKRSND